MDVVMPYYGALAVIVLCAWLQERWKFGTLVLSYTIHGLGKCYIAMMRHTGDPRYCHKPRRYRS